MFQHTTNAGGTTLQSPNLRFRDSQTIWGPLRIFIGNHREGAELGYEAGKEAYQQTRQKYGFNGQLGFLTVQSFHDLMDYYLGLPRYRPRQATEQILEEWRALFLFSWTQQVMQAHPQLLGENTNSSPAQQKATRK